MRLIGFIVILFTLNTATATEKPKLTILSHAYFANEFDKNSVNRHLNAVIKPALADEFDIDVEITNHARLLKRLSGNEASCTYNAIKTQNRSKAMIFSTIPTYMHVQRRLYALKSTLKSGSEPISVTELLKSKASFGIVGSTSYRELDSIFADKKFNVATIYGENAFLQLSRLLFSKRIDYIVAYKQTLDVHIPAHELNQLTSRRIAEYPEFINGFFTCSKNTEGYRAMSLINDYMQKVEMAAYIKELHQQMNDPSDAEAMLKIYTNEYGILFQND